MKIKKVQKFSPLSILGIACGAIIATGASAVGSTVQQIGTVTIVSASDQSNQAGGAAIDYKNAKAMVLPTLNKVLSQQTGLASASTVSLGTPGSSAGGIGNGQQEAVQVPESNFLEEASKIGSSSEITPQEYGTTNHPYTTSRVNALNNYTAATYPYRAAGKLFFNIGSATYVCSASLIKPGVIVTAAHCVADFGKKTFYSNWKFIPAYNRGVAPYEVWSGTTAVIMSSYYDGTEACAVSGVVCPNDVAVIRLAPRYTSSGSYYHAGHRTGWYGYGWNGYGYTTNPLITQQIPITQVSALGYPVALDNGGVMQRTDSYGFVDSASSNNTVIGSLQTGGSSGGPWLVNLGVAPVLNGTSFGSAATHNVVVGVTSWGYVSNLPKEQGASPFTSGNIVPLVNFVCTRYPSACK